MRVTPWQLARLLGVAGVPDNGLEALSWALVVVWPRPDGYVLHRQRWINHARRWRDNPPDPAFKTKLITILRETSHLAA